MTKAKRAVIYCRISDDKAGESLGVIRQQTDCEALAKSLDWAVAQVIVENDRSAYSGRTRPGYQQLLDGLRNGTYDGVLAWHSDRLHRRPIELEEYIHICQAHGIRTHTVKGGEIDLATPEGMLRAGMLGQIARYESAHKSDRITRAHQQAAEQGKYRGGGRPFGYLDDATTPHPDEAPLIVEAYKAVIRGESMRSIAAHWNDLGFTGSRGRPFSNTTLRIILNRQRNFGASVYKGQIVKRDAFTPIISEDTYIAAQAALDNPAYRARANNTGRWLLSGLALCGVCAAEGIEATMGSGQIKDRNGKNHTVYKCRLKHHLGRRATYCDEYVTDTLLGRLEASDAPDLIKREDPDEAVMLREQVEALREKLGEYALLLADDVMTRTQFREATIRTKERLKIAERALYPQGMSPLVKRLLEAPDKRAEWDLMGWAQKRSVIRAFMTVTILPVPKGGPRAFDPRFVDPRWADEMGPA